ncbi:MAG: hypothetical protein ACJ8FY_02660 [Gemmataceae bacterium]
MKKTKKKREEDEAVWNRTIYGVHFSFEGGEEDDTVRPTALSPETLKAMKEDCPPLEYSDPLNHNPKKKKK